MITHQDIGKKGELYVCEYLVKQHFTIKAVNYRQRFGEIDIIAQQKNTIIFVEVKVRSQEYFPLSEIITPSKQKKIIQTACHYRHRHALSNSIMRFDVALLTLTSTQNYEITYIADAFRPSEEFFA